MPDGFNLQNYIDSGAFNYIEGDITIWLKVIFDKQVASHLEETTLSHDQAIHQRHKRIDRMIENDYK